MLQTTLTCGKCGSTALRKNGSRNGQPKYQCTACRHQALFVPAAVGKAARYAQVAALLLERLAVVPGELSWPGNSGDSRAHCASVNMLRSLFMPKGRP